MTNWIMRMLFVATGAGVIASACAVSSSDSGDSKSAAESELASCCSAGTFVCPGVDVWNYGPPGCDDFTKPAASIACHATWDQSCRYTGWKQVSCSSP